MRVNALYASLPTTIFTVMSGLAREHDAINLGQGFPDEPGPLAIRQAAAREAIEGDNQYPPMAGVPVLREAVAAHYRARQGLDLDWRAEVTITSGATEALAAAFLALIEPGDEVVLFEPAYDSYAPMVRRAGGTARFVRLRPPDWTIERQALERAFSPRTRLVVLNDPMNPTAKRASPTELKLLADFCQRFDAVALCDEVWEEVVFGPPHCSLMGFPGMRERTVKIGSAGKMFALTGWKVGFLIAAPALTQALAKAHQFLTFTTPPNLQAAVAFGLNSCAEWFAAMPGRLRASRDLLTEALEAEGFAVPRSAGTYFLTVDLARSGVAMDDAAFCLMAVKEAGVAAIPISPFYDQAPETSVIRLCFAKGDETLAEGARRLARARDLARRPGRGAPAP